MIEQRIVHRLKLKFSAFTQITIVKISGRHRFSEGKFVESDPTVLNKRENESNNDRFHRYLASNQNRIQCSIVNRSTRFSADSIEFFNQWFIIDRTKRFQSHRFLSIDGSKISLSEIRWEKEKSMNECLQSRSMLDTIDRSLQLSDDANQCRTMLCSICVLKDRWGDERETMIHSFTISDVCWTLFTCVFSHADRIFENLIDLNFERIDWDMNIDSSLTIRQPICAVIFNNCNIVMSLDKGKDSCMSKGPISKLERWWNR